MKLSKKLIAAISAIVLTVICAVTLVGCTGQKITADEFKQYLSKEDINSIENYAMTATVRDYSMKVDAKGKEFVDNDNPEVFSMEKIIVNDKKIKMTSIDGTKKKAEIDRAKSVGEKNPNRDAFEQEIIFDVENSKTYTYSFTDKKYTVSDTNIDLGGYVTSAELFDYIENLLNYQYDEFKYSRNTYKYFSTNTVDTTTTNISEDIKFAGNKLSYLVHIKDVKNKISDTKISGSESKFYVECYKQTVKIPTGKKIA